MMIITGTKTKKISKGYRLKTSTHKLIDKMQTMMNANQDIVITEACKLLYEKLKLFGYTRSK